MGNPFNSLAVILRIENRTAEIMPSKIKFLDTNVSEEESIAIKKVT